MIKESSINKRAVSVGLSITFLLFVLAIRLAYIQVVKAKEYSERAIKQRTISISIENMRGDILDRNGIPFTKGEERSYLLLFPGLLHEDTSITDKIQSMTGMDKDEILRIAKISTSYVKKEIVRPIPEWEIAIEKGEYPGIMVLRERTRYGDTSLARHVIGYLKQSDQVPVAGIEKEYDQYLRSEGSLMMYAVTDAKNHVIPGVGFRILGSSDPYCNLQLTLDYHIQKALENALDQDGGRGGGVVVDIETGDILALASRPNFEQINIQASIDQGDSLWSVPMTAFSPGSIFKIVVAAAALEEGFCDGDTPYTCTGEIIVNGVIYSCHPEAGGLGDITMKEAFAHSCNDAFIRAAMDIGGNKVVEMAKKFGLGKSLDIGLDNDAGGLPDESEYAGAGIGNLAIGQGKIETTPLQIANMMAIIANGGVRKELSLVKNLLSQQGEVIQEMRSKNQDIRIIDFEIAEELKEWMKCVTEFGTGTQADSIAVGGISGKTGTPEIAGDPEASYYGWFAGFFPHDQPRYAIAILSREESNGGERAARIFKNTAEEIYRYSQKLETP